MSFRILSTLTVMAAFIFTNACSQSGSNLNNTDPNLKSQLDSVSYAIGYRNAEFLVGQGISDVNKENYLAGFNAALADQENAFSDQEIQTMITSYLQKINQERGAANIEEGQAFLEENQAKDSIQVTESGLQYKVIKEGSGESPEASDRVSVHYEGRLINGEVFDSSYERGEPATFPLNRVIPGWTEGVQLMKEGAVYELYIPGELAYGSRPPQGSPIGPNQTLIFKVELLEILDEQSSQN